MDKFIEKRLRPGAAKRDLISGDISGSDFEIGDTLFGTSLGRGLAGKPRQPVEDKLVPLLILHGADASRDDNLNHPRGLHDVFITLVGLESFKRFSLCDNCRIHT